MKAYFLKALFFGTVLSFLIVMYTSFRDVINTKAIISTENIVEKNYVTDSKIIKANNENNNNENSNTTKTQSEKYILQWTSDKTIPFVDMGKGNSGFIKRKCPYVNCIVTSDAMLLEDYTKFDIIVFAGPEITDRTSRDDFFPERRSLHQKYVFASIESSHNYKICKGTFNDYFNWTWTYKLDSEVRWGYIVIRDMQNHIVGPNIEMHWLKLEEMDQLTEDFKNKLKTKRKAAAWLVSNCFTLSHRELFASNLIRELNRYKQTIDVYGSCGAFSCHIDDKDCGKAISDHYYFYLSFENAFSEDYVTEKLLHALKNDAVPIVYGGANYTRFMPEGTYLNARELGIKKLAEKMIELMNDPEKYANYFKWKNHYSYHRTVESVETNEYCKFCEILNNEEAVKKNTVYRKFQDWWNPPDSC